MKGKLLMLWLVLFTSCVFAQTWVRHLEWEDLVPAWEHYPVATANNVIPAVDGGYIMQGILTLRHFEVENFYRNIFWKISPTGEIVWRIVQQEFHAQKMVCLVSNGIDKYYGLISHCHWNILYTYDTQLNTTNRIVIDTMFTNGELLTLNTVNVVDDGLLISGSNWSDSFLMKLNNNMELVWSRTYQEPSYYGGFFSVFVSQEGSITCSSTYKLYWLSSLGDTLHVYNVESPLTYLTYIVPHSDGSFFVQCSMDTNQYGFAHFDSAGNYISVYPYTLPGNTGGVYKRYTNSTDQQIIIFQERYDRYPEWQDYGILHKFSLTGENQWNSLFFSTSNDQDIGHGNQSLCIDDQGYYILCLDPMTIIRADENGNAVSNNDPSTDTPGIVSVHAYPNPAKDRINFVFSGLPRSSKLSMSIYNLRGQLMDQIVIGEITRQLQWELPTDLESGVYLVRIKDGSLPISSSKFTIIK